jgi:hypothetical protein
MDPFDAQCRELERQLQKLEEALGSIRKVQGEIARMEEQIRACEERNDLTTKGVYVDRLKYLNDTLVEYSKLRGVDMKIVMDIDALKSRLEALKSRQTSSK